MTWACAVRDGRGVPDTHPGRRPETNSYLALTWLEAKRQWRSRDILIFRLGIPVAIYLVLRAHSHGAA
jgi:hypothetical protein